MPRGCGIPGDQLELRPRAATASRCTAPSTGRQIGLRCLGKGKRKACHSYAPSVSRIVRGREKDDPPGRRVRAGRFPCFAGSWPATREAATSRRPAGLRPSLVIAGKRLAKGYSASGGASAAEAAFVARVTVRAPRSSACGVGSAPPPHGVLSRSARAPGSPSQSTSIRLLPGVSGLGVCVPRIGAKRHGGSADEGNNRERGEEDEDLHS